MFLNYKYNIISCKFLILVFCWWFILESGDLCTAIQSGTGRFELCLNNTMVLSGYIFVIDQHSLDKDAKTVHGENLSSGCGNSIVSLSHDEVYSNIEQFGCNVGDVFKTIRHVNIYEDSMRNINIILLILYIITNYHAKNAYWMVFLFIFFQTRKVWFRLQYYKTYEYWYLLNYYLGNLNLNLLNYWTGP